MPEPKLRFKKIIIYAIADDEHEHDTDSQIDWVVSQADTTRLRVAGYEIENWGQTNDGSQSQEPLANSSS